MIVEEDAMNGGSMEEIQHPRESKMSETKMNVEEQDFYVTE